MTITRVPRRAVLRRLVRTASIVVGTALLTGTWGCASTPEQTPIVAPTSLVGEWSIASVTVDGETLNIPAGAPGRIFVRFTPDPSGTGATEVNGFAGVNRFFGTAKLGPDDRVTIDGLGSTRMAGPPVVMAFENQLLAALRGVERWRAESSGATLHGPTTKLWLLPDPPR